MDRIGVREVLLAAAVAACLAAAGCSSSPVGTREESAVEDAEETRDAKALPAAPTSGVAPQGSFLVTLFPSPPTSRDPVKAALRDAASHMEKEVSYWTWYVNGEKTQAEGPVFPPGKAKRGDEVFAEAAAFSGGKGITVASPRVRIANSPPMVSEATFNSLSPGKGDLLKVDARVDDPDGDPVRLTYRWMVNGKAAQEGEKAEYSLSGASRGDQIHCEVYPSDGDSPGTWKSTPVVEVVNSPPRFLTEPPGEARPDGTFSYRVSAEDVDGDPVRIEVANGPEGMVLDRDTVRWSPAAGFGGEAQVTIRATDGRGGEARQSFVLDVAVR